MLGKHPVGIYEKAFSSEISWQQRLDQAAKLGFDYVEISIDETDQRLSRLDWGKGQKKELLDAIWDSGISLRSMCLSAHRRFPFGSGDPVIRQRAYDIMKKAIEFAGELGIRVIQLAGYDVYYEPSTPDSVRCFAEGMAWAAEQARAGQIMLAMEIMDTPFMNSVTKHMVYEAQLHNPWYRVYPDLGNLSAWPENDPAAELEKGIDSIVAVHLKDTLPPREDFPGQFKCVPFGAGCVDFPARFAQLESLGYTGPYMIEMWHQEGTDDMEEIAKASVWLDEQYKKGTKRGD